MPLFALLQCAAVGPTAPAKSDKRDEKYRPISRKRDEEHRPCGRSLRDSGNTTRHLCHLHVEGGSPMPVRLAVPGGYVPRHVVGNGATRHRSPTTRHRSPTFRYGPYLCNIAAHVECCVCTIEALRLHNLGQLCATHSPVSWREAAGRGGGDGTKRLEFLKQFRQLCGNHTNSFGNMQVSSWATRLLTSMAGLAGRSAPRPASFWTISGCRLLPQPHLGKSCPIHERSKDQHAECEGGQLVKVRRFDAT